MCSPRIARPKPPGDGRRGVARFRTSRDLLRVTLRARRTGLPRLAHGAARARGAARPRRPRATSITPARFLGREVGAVL